MCFINCLLGTLGTQNEEEEDTKLGTQEEEEEVLSYKFRQLGIFICWIKSHISVEILKVMGL